MGEKYNIPSYGAIRISSHKLLRVCALEIFRDSQRDFLERVASGCGVEVIECLQAFRCFVDEAGEVFLPQHFDFPRWTVTLLGNDNFRLARILFSVIPALIVFFTVNKYNNISVLLDRTRFTQVV